MFLHKVCALLSAKCMVTSYKWLYEYLIYLLHHSLWCNRNLRFSSKAVAEEIIKIVGKISFHIFFALFYWLDFWILFTFSLSHNWNFFSECTSVVQSLMNKMKLVQVLNFIEETYRWKIPTSEKKNWISLLTDFKRKSYYN